MKKIFKAIYTTLWLLVAAIGMILFFEIAWLVVNW